MSKHSLNFRLLISVLLMIGYYILALSIVVVLLFLTYLQSISVKYGVSIYFGVMCVIGSGVILWSILPRYTKFKKPGPLLQRTDYPVLFKLIDDLSQVTGQKAPKEVYLTYEFNAWVTQRGGFLGIGSKRIMGIGLPLFQLLTVSQLKSIIAHEFGHYYAGDTRLAPLNYKLRKVIERTIYNLTQTNSGLANIFVSYGKMFLKITHATLRTQEIEADIFAAQISGCHNFINALKVIYSSNEILESFWKKEVTPIIKAGYRPAISNSFKQYIQSKMIQNKMKDNLEREMKYPNTNEFNTHPPLSERISAIERAPYKSVAEDIQPAILLLEDINKAEVAILTFVLNKKINVDKLVTINWEDNNKAYITIWKSDIRKFIPALKGITPDQLPVAYFPLIQFTSKVIDCLDIDFEYESGKELAYTIIGEALSLLLFNRGWKLNKIPGDKITLRTGNKEIEPFSTLLNLSKGIIDLQEWQLVCVEMGISGVDLGAEIEALINDF